jgi:hypothetical protein
VGGMREGGGRHEREDSGLCCTLLHSALVSAALRFCNAGARGCCVGGGGGGGGVGTQ